MLRTVSLVFLLAAGEAPSTADHLARSLGISVEEAEARMRLTDRLGIFQLRARSDPDFAGAYLEHEPKVQAVVLFRGDAAAKLKQYVSGDEGFTARSVTYSLADLEAARADAAKAFKAAGLAPVGISIDIEANRIVADFVSAAPARTAIAAGKLDLAAPVVLEEIEGDIALKPQSAGAVTHFPQARNPSTEGFHALTTGRLFVSNGCLRVGSEAGESQLVLWPATAKLGEQDGQIVVTSGAGKKLVVGSDVSLAGGAVVGSPPPGWLLEPVTGACAGPYWIAAQDW